MRSYYTVIMYFNPDVDNQILETGLTLGEARSICKDPETSSRTATSEEAAERTSKYGPWFVGYDRKKEQ